VLVVPVTDPGYNKDARVLGAANDTREHGARGIVSGETGPASARPDVNNQGLNIIIERSCLQRETVLIRRTVTASLIRF
jgi:hypothetical protein